MATKFVIRPQSLSLTFLSPPRFILNPLSLPKTFSFSLLSTATTAASATLNQAFSYGPSLHKGQKPPYLHLLEPPVTPSSTAHKLPDKKEESQGENLIDEGNFTRVFDIAALRVPAEQCFALESRLRGHLLNWPRVRNIARVPGDEIEDKFRNLFENPGNSGSDDEDGNLASLNRRIYGKADGDGEPLSPVLYRDKLARTFNSKGYAKFRNLAKLSRPKKRKKEEGKERKKKGVGKNDFAVVEVVEEEGEDDLSGLLGEEFKGKKWRGSTRLLLLDERYAGKSLDQLPEAIKVAIPTH